MRRLRFNFRLSTLMAWLLSISLTLALVAQHRSAERREQALVSRLGQAELRLFTFQTMHHMISNLGVIILKEPTGAELLRVFRPTGTPTGETFGKYDVAPNGGELGAEIALQFASVLLDQRNYGCLNGDDLSEPQIGLRIKHDTESIDVLINLKNIYKSNYHQNLWININDEWGKIVHFAGPICLSDPKLQKLTESLSRMIRPDKAQ